MFIKNKTLDERCMEIYEEDIVNNQTILVVSVYCVRNNDDVWQFPAPQIWNEALYKRYKDKYDERISEFREMCSGIKPDVSSMILNEIQKLKDGLLVTQNALSMYQKETNNDENN